MHWQRNSRRRAMSLIEALIAVSMMGAIAILYSSAWNTHRAQNEAARDIETATLLYLRQVERLKSISPKDWPPSAGLGLFGQDDAFRSDVCPPSRPSAGITDPALLNLVTGPRTYYRGGGPLHPPVRYEVLLVPGNSALISPGVMHTDGRPFVLALTGELALKYDISVRVMRVHNLRGAPTVDQLNNTDSYLHQLVKYCVRVDRVDDGPRRNLLTGEFLQEVR